MEDGCSKRFDIGTMDLRAENANGSGSTKRQFQSKAGNATESTTAPSRSFTATLPSPMAALPVAPSMVIGGSGVTEPAGAWAAAR